MSSAAACPALIHRLLSFPSRHPFRSIREDEPPRRPDTNRSHSELPARGWSRQLPRLQARRQGTRARSAWTRVSNHKLERCGPPRLCGARRPLVPLPAGMVMMVPGKWPPVLRSELLSARAKVRLLQETFRKPQQRTEDISVGRFVEDHFGSEVLEFIADPLLSGVYGGDAASLSAASVLPRFVAYEQKYGSLIRGARRELRRKKNREPLFQSFRDGMQVLTDSLAREQAADASAWFTPKCPSVQRSGSLWQVSAGEQTFSSPDLVLACPAHVCARLLEGSARHLRKNCRRFRTRPPSW